MRAMFEQLSTPDSLKKQVAIPGAGDHVIGSYIKSKDIASVQREIHQYAEQVLRLPLK
jgi:hypothetical protein